MPKYIIFMAKKPNPFLLFWAWFCKHTLFHAVSFVVPAIITCLASSLSTLCLSLTLPIPISPSPCHCCFTCSAIEWTHSGTQWLRCCVMMAPTLCHLFITRLDLCHKQQLCMCVCVCVVGWGYAHLLLSLSSAQRRLTKEFAIYLARAVDTLATFSRFLCHKAIAFYGNIKMRLN